VYNLYRGSALGNESPIVYAALVAPAPVSPLTSAAASVGPNATYQGTIANGGSDALAGMTVTITGFVAATNNGTFTLVSSTATAITVANPAAVVEVASGSVKPRPYFTDTAVIPGKVYSYLIKSSVGGIESTSSIEILSPPVPFAPTPPFVDVGVAASFEVLAGSTVTNTGATTVAGDVGVSPGTSIVGFGPPASISGAFHIADFVAANAQTAATAAYVDASTRAGAVTIPADIGGMTFGPGVYNVATSLAITGILTLDAGGDPDAVFIFQVGSTLTTAVTNSVVLLENGARAQNVIFAVGSSATLNGGTAFVGTIIAQASITVNAGVNVDGRLLALTGAITLNTDTIEMFLEATLAFYAGSSPYPLGAIFFDCATGTYQQVIVAGTTGATRPTFGIPIGSLTYDGTVTWISLDPLYGAVSTGLPPSPPNTPPAPPAPPTSPAISSED
jgi:hypothetical protein